MHSEKKFPLNSLSGTTVRKVIPHGVFIQLGLIASRFKQPIYLGGGTIRDIILGRKIHDLDLTVGDHCELWATELARYTGAPLIPLGRDEQAYRVIIDNFQIDISPFRGDSNTIEQDLTLRDLTINSMAVALDRAFFTSDTPADHTFPIIDPLGGLEDLNRRVIRHASNRSFTDDPLRMLRVFRFAAVLNFTIDESTVNLVSCRNQMIGKSAGERINFELEEIMASDRAAETFSDMDTCGLLGEIIPQLLVGRGMSQPESHHLDVLGHSMAALASMEKIVSGPERYFPPLTLAALQKYLGAPKRRIELKWAALLHDIGKTTTRKIKNDSKITFYNHDVVGAQLIEEIAGRLHWSNVGTRRITSLIHAHMRPFHLCNVARKGELSLKACIRLLKVIDVDFPGLFLLAMADASACKGEESPATMREEIGALLNRVIEVYHNNILPVHSTVPILNGKDLIEIFHLEPGPIFSRLLEVVRLAHMEKTSMTREEALTLVQKDLKKHNRNNPER